MSMTLYIYKSWGNPIITTVHVLLYSSMRKFTPMTIYGSWSSVAPACIVSACDDLYFVHLYVHLNA